MSSLVHGRALPALSHRINELRVEAQRCFRLAHGIASFELAEELEKIGLAFEREANELTKKTQFA